MIVLDGIIFALQYQGGISSYFSALGTRILALHSDAELWMYAGSDLLPPDTPVLRKTPRLFERYRDPASVPRDAILHSSYYRASSEARANVVTVYDFMYERFADPMRRFVHVRQKRAAMSRADAIICISAATKHDLLEFYPRIPESRVHVVHLAGGPEFFPIAGPGPDDAFAPYALFVGKRTGYKNFASAVNGVAAVPGMRLMCVGGGEWSASERSLLERVLHGRYMHTGYVDNPRLNELYNGAHALLYASRFEGFGIPILEAMAAGCPVITTRVGSMTEVAGDAALLVDEPDAESIAGALRALLDPATRTRQVALGARRAAQFSWDATVTQTLAIYSTLR